MLRKHVFWRRNIESCEWSEMRVAEVSRRSYIESIESIEPIDQSTDRSNRSKATMVSFFLLQSGLDNKFFVFYPVPDCCSDHRLTPRQLLLLEGFKNKMVKVKAKSVGLKI